MAKQSHLENKIAHLLLSKIPVEFAVSLTHHNDRLFLAQDTANFFGFLALRKVFYGIIWLNDFTGFGCL